MQRRGLGLQRHHVPRLVCRPRPNSSARLKPYPHFWQVITHAARDRSPWKLVARFAGAREPDLPSTAWRISLSDAGRGLPDQRFAQPHDHLAPRPLDAAAEGTRTRRSRLRRPNRSMASLIPARYVRSGGA